MPKPQEKPQEYMDAPSGVVIGGYSVTNAGLQHMKLFGFNPTADDVQQEARTWVSEFVENLAQWFDANNERIKEETGFDFQNHTQEEWNAYYLSIAEKEAESNEYFREILNTSKRIIDEKDYSGLVKMQQNYDELVKAKLDRAAEKSGISSGQKWADLELPYWCYACTAPSTANES